MFLIDDSIQFDLLVTDAKLRFKADRVMDGQAVVFLEKGRRVFLRRIFNHSLATRETAMAFTQEFAERIWAMDPEEHASFGGTTRDLAEEIADALLDFCKSL